MTVRKNSPRLSAPVSHPPVLEQLEGRHLLSAVTVLPANYLHVGNNWEYTYKTTPVGKPTASTTWDLQVTGSKVWSGHNCKIIQSTVTTSGFPVVHELYDYLSPANLMEAGGSYPANGAYFTVHGTKVWSPEPRKVNTTDKNRLLSSGQYDNKDSQGNVLATVTDKSYVTYLGTANLTLKVNGKSTTLHTVKVQITHTYTTTANSDVTKNVATVWYAPTIGRVKVQQTDYVNNVKMDTTNGTLNSYSVT